MFGSVGVVSREKPSKKDKKDKKKKKKSKKDKKRKRSSSSASSSASSEKGLASARRRAEDDELFGILLGANNTTAAFENKDWLSDRHDPSLRRTPRDEAEMMRAGLKGRFAASSTNDNQATALHSAKDLPAIPGDTLLKEVIDSDGLFDGVFVPVHMRETRTVAEWEKLMEQKGKQPSKRHKKNPEEEEEYKGIGDLVAESKRERFADSAAMKAADVKQAMGKGCMISYGTERFSKENVISLGNHTILTLPVYSALTEGQCYITTTERRLSELDMEDEELTEVRNFKKCLMQKAAEEGCQMLFAEVSIPSFRRQTFIDCIPIPNEEFRDIELYFYKALDECENEFIQTHKRVVDTKGKQLKHCLASGIPYVNISFNLDGGYAHVIADKSSFPKYIVNDICGPILGVGMGGRLSTKQREYLVGAEARKRFRTAWDKYDWTKMLDREEGESDEEAPRGGEENNEGKDGSEEG